MPINQSIKGKLKLKDNQPAFTLAEVLITLGIIGVVAALTIPVIAKKVFEVEAVARAKETYSILTQVWTQWLEDTGCRDNYGNCINYRQVYLAQGGWWILYLSKELKPYFKGVDMYNGGNYSSNWVPTTAASFDGDLRDSKGTPNIKLSKGLLQDTNAVFLLPNGTVVRMVSVIGTQYAFYFVFDINNSTPPNRIGKDQFIITVADDGKMSPYYYCYHGGFASAPKVDGLCNKAATDCNPDDGDSPLATILMDGTLPDPGKLGYPSTP